MSTIKVKITKAEWDICWYHDKIGEIFEVSDTVKRDYDGNFNYLLLGDKIGHSIAVGDCEVIEQPTEEIPIVSNTLKTLMLYTKLSNDPHTLQAVTDVLKPLYHDDLMMFDVIKIVIKAHKEAENEPRFEMPHEYHNLERIIFSPVIGHHAIDTWGPKNKDVSYTVEQFYTAILMSMLSDIRMTRVDWLMLSDK